MSVCTFIASNTPLHETPAQKEYSLTTGAGDNVNDNFYLHIFKDVRNYTEKKYGVWLEWQYTDRRAKKILEYI